MRHLTRGNEGFGASITFEPGPDRIFPPTRTSTVYHGPGFANAPQEAIAGPYGIFTRLTWEFIGGCLAKPSS